MARVIVILALMLLISALIFGLTRKQGGSGAPGVDAEAHATVPLPGTPDAAATSGTEAGLKPAGEKAASDVQTAQDVMSGLVSGAAPAFATVGVDNRGRASFTGTASPGDQVIILHDGKQLGSSHADKDGSWTIDFKVPNVREDYALELAARRSSGQTVRGPQRAIVSPPETAGGLQHITLETVQAEQKPDAGTSSQPDVGIVIEKVDADKDGTAVLKGRSDPGARLHATIDGKAAGEATVGKDGKWILAVRNETGQPTSGVQIVLSTADGRELDRADVPLKLSAGQMKPADQVVADTATKVITSNGIGSAAATAVVNGTAAAAIGEKRGHYVKVRRGDSLWRIARRHYGDGRRWTRIYNANRRKIQDPDFLRPGRRIYLPD